MKSLITRLVPGALVVLLAAGGGIAVTTIAQVQTSAAAPAPMPPHPPMGSGGPEGPGLRGRHRMMELDRLKTSLKLDAGQTALWDKAQEQRKPATDLRDRMRARHERLAALLDDPGFEPRKLAADLDSAESERHAKMSGLRDAWFAVYDSLNPVQRGQAREFLRSHMARPHGMGERMGWMHRHDGEGDSR